MKIFMKKNNFDYNVLKSKGLTYGVYMKRNLKRKNLMCRISFKRIGLTYGNYIRKNLIKRKNLTYKISLKRKIMKKGVNEIKSVSNDKSGSRCGVV